MEMTNKLYETSHSAYVPVIICKRTQGHYNDSRICGMMSLMYPMYNDHIYHLVNGWLDICEPNIILKGVSIENNPPYEFSEF
jgi:hypothetical protein